MDYPTRAILQPASASAEFSFGLTHNKSVIVQALAIVPRALSPPSSGDEDSGTRSRFKKSFIVKEDPDQHCINLGSGYDNEVVLQHPLQGEEEDPCYIQVRHCQIYLDPDSSAIWLQNSSNSVYTIKRMDSPTTESVYQTKSACLSTGVWIVKLGLGLVFVVQVLNTPLNTSTRFYEPIAKTRQQGHSSKATSPSTRRPAQQALSPRDHGISKAIEPMAPDKSQGEQATRESRRSTAQPRIARQDSTQTTQPKALEESQNKQATQESNRSTVQPRVTSQDSIETAKAKALEELQDEQATQISIGHTAESRVVSRQMDGILRAVKICRRPDVPKAAELWLQEVRMLRMVGDHPNIVHLIGADTLKREIILSLASGRSLDKFIDGNMSNLNRSDCDYVWRGVADGLLWIHSRGIIHNDLKPHNIMFDPDKSSTVIIDFDNACQGILSRHCGGGTPCYAAPEILIAQRSYPYDIWSFGVTLLFVLGEIPLPEKINRGWVLANIRADAKEAVKMNIWLRKIGSIRDKLSPSLNLLRLMLTYKATDRISARDLALQLDISGSTAVLLDATNPS